MCIKDQLTYAFYSALHRISPIATMEQETYQEAMYPNVTSLYFVLLPLLRLTFPTEGFPWDDLSKILHGGQRMATNVAESFNPLGRAHERYRRQTDLR